MSKTGVIKSYNPSNRYGFITSDGVDYRFHKNDWGLSTPPRKGIKVEFLHLTTEKGGRAFNVRKAAE